MEKEEKKRRKNLDEGSETSFAKTSRHRTKRSSNFSKEKKKPPYRKEKKLFRQRSFSRHYQLFRKNGLSRRDSLFNAFYIIESERSIAKKKKMLQRDGTTEITSEFFLEYHSPFLRFLSAAAVKIRSVGAAIRHLFLAPFQKKDGSYTKHRLRWIFFKTHWVHCCVGLFALLIACYMLFVLYSPVVLRASIDGKTIGVVESINTVDSAINELEDHVERILGKSYHFPYEVEYTFSRFSREEVTSKAAIATALRQYVQDAIRNAAGLYVDGTLVAVCENEEIIQQELDAFLLANTKGEEIGFFNEINVITQGYPADKIVSGETVSLLLREMSLPLADRKRDPATDGIMTPGVTDPSEAPEEDSVPAMILLSDSNFTMPEESTRISNQPRSIDNIKLDLYTTKTVSYEADVPYRTVYRESAEHYTSMTDITTRGINGRSQLTEKIYYVNGKIAKRETLSETPIIAPVDQVVSIGIKILPEDNGITEFYGGLGRFIPPRIGFVYSAYGMRDEGFHYGWDIPGTEGDSIYAAASGTVRVAIAREGQEMGYSGYGLCVIVDHGNGYSTMYAHCSEILVRVGQKVKQGEKIALLGNTGRSTGPHVHFEIIKNNAKVDPQSYIYRGNATIYQ